jgi:hypothetical protein
MKREKKGISQGMERSIMVFNPSSIKKRLKR